MSFTQLSISPAILPTIRTEENQFTQSTNKKTIIQREKSGSMCWHTVTVVLMKCNSELNNVRPLTRECKRTTNESHVTSAHRYQHAVCLCTNVTTKAHQVQSNTETTNPRRRGNTGARGYYGEMQQLRWLLSSKQQPAKETGTLPCLGSGLHSQHCWEESWLHSQHCLSATS